MTLLALTGGETALIVLAAFWGLLVLFLCLVLLNTFRRARGDPPHGRRDARGDRPAAPGDQGLRRDGRTATSTGSGTSSTPSAASSGGWSD